MSRRQQAVTKEPAEGGRETVARALQQAAQRTRGTAQPLRGVSGALRRVAYQIPEHRARHWLLLLLADRVDVVESQARQRPGLAAALGGGALLGFALWRAGGRSRR